MDKPDIPRADKRVSLDVETGTVNLLSDLIECPLCAGKGNLSRTYLYDQLGVRDMAKLATHTAKEAVTELTSTLWRQYEENLKKQVADQAEALNSDIDKLKSEKSELDAQIKALNASIATKEDAARAAQKNEDRAMLLSEKEKLQAEIAELKGQIAEAKAELDAASKQRGLDVKDAAEQVKQDLTERIDRLNEALLDERKANAELQTKLERALSEVKQQALDAKAAAYEEKQKDLDAKQQQINEMKEELADLRAKVKAFPDQESVAVQKAINEHEGKLRKLELDRDTLQKERDGLKDELADARQKLEDRKGKVEERTFEQLMDDVPGIWIENKSSRGKQGDFHVGLTSHDNEQIKGSHVVVDNKDKPSGIKNEDVDKLIKDAKKHQTALAAIVLSDASGMRRKDRDDRFALRDGVYVLFTTRDWFARELDLLRPLMRMQSDRGPDFLKQSISGVAAEVRSRLKALDAIDRSMELAVGHIEKARKDLTGWLETIDDLCRAAISGNSSVAQGDEE